MASSKVERTIESLVVLVADSNAYTRKLTRFMLLNCGVKSIYEVSDGIAALESIRTVSPDVLIVDWELPGLDGGEVTRIVRSPDVFPKPNLPIIMLIDDGLYSTVVAATRLGVHEILIKPVSSKMLQDRLLSVALSPRPMVRAGSYYVPLPRRRADMKDILDAAAAEPADGPDFLPLAAESA
jgi:CheY-like chemotaxis protein